MLIDVRVKNLVIMSSRHPAKGLSTMPRFCRAVLLSLSALILTAIPVKQNPILQINSGKIEGIVAQTQSGDLVDSYLGIPFAEPPINKLRFLPPVTKASWKGVLKTQTQPDTCYQKLIPLSKFVPALEIFLPKTPMSEDCLKLNVWTPSKRSSRPLPVMFWIFGGGFSRGAASLSPFDPKNLVVQEEVVVVVCNYRVASLGFFYLGETAAPGNVGLLDQVMALQWVKDNIAYFGGDPNLVTLFGQSAGGASVVYHTMSPMSKGLFKRAIIQSGAPHAEYGFASTEEMKNHSLNLLQSINCPSTQDKLSEAMECLITKDPMEILSSEPQGEYDNVYTFKPIMDKRMVTDHPINLLKMGKVINSEEILLGSNRDEGAIFLLALLPLAFRFQERLHVGEEDVRELGRLLKLGKSAEEVIRLLYLDSTKEINWKIAANLALQGMSDYLFTCPLNDVAHYTAKSGRKVFKYFFTHRSSNSLWPSWAGTVHGEEIPYVFGLPFDRDKGYSNEERKLSERIMRLWANFARTGNPNIMKNGQLENIEWPLYSPSQKEYLVLAPNATAVGSALRERTCQFWTHTRPILDKIERSNLVL